VVVLLTGGFPRLDCSGNHDNQSKYGNQGMLGIPNPVISVPGNACKVCPLLFDFSPNWNACASFSKTSQYRI
jgi:hypothetical protein